MSFKSIAVIFKKFVENRVDLTISLERITVKSHLSGKEKSSETYIYVDSKKIVRTVGLSSPPKSEWTRMHGFREIADQLVLQTIVSYLLMEISDQKFFIRPNIHVYGANDVPDALFLQINSLDSSTHKVVFFKELAINAGAKKVIIET